MGNTQNSVGKTETQLRAVLAQWLLKPWETASAPWAWVMDRTLIWNLRKAPGHPLPGHIMSRVLRGGGIIWGRRTFRSQLDASQASPAESLGSPSRNLGWQGPTGAAGLVWLQFPWSRDQYGASAKTWVQSGGPGEEEDVWTLCSACGLMKLCHVRPRGRNHYCCAVKWSL